VPHTLKIGFTGLHASGKTTTIHDVATELERAKVKVFVMDEMAGKASEGGFDLHRDKGFALQLWLIAAQIKLELEATRRGYDVILVERPVMDALPYARVSLQDGVMTQQEYSFLADTCWGYARTAPYHCIFALGELHGRGAQEEAQVMLHRKIADALRVYLAQLTANVNPDLTKVEFIEQKDRNERRRSISGLIIEMLSKAESV